MSTIGGPDQLLFTELRLENVRAFKAAQRLSLVDEAGQPSKWNLILGENGVGKTTLMQTLARLRPVPAGDPKTSRGNSKDAGPPTKVEAELSQHENDEVARFLRADHPGAAKLSAAMAAPNGDVVETSAMCETDGRSLNSVKFPTTTYSLRGNGPLVIGYGAARHIGTRNMSLVAERDPVSSLFDRDFDLIDAEEIIGDMDYAKLSSRSKRDSEKLQALLEAVGDLLHVRSVDIYPRGPKTPGRSPADSGVHVRTPSGVVPLDALSVGSQTVTALTVDLAWRLFTAYPTAAKPMRQGGVVLLDEIDLHLHPHWQREIRGRLTSHFPNIQFIATTHSPVMAQETLAAGGNVAVVRLVDDASVIMNRPIPSAEWRFDQVLNSELFGFESTRGPEAEKVVRERRALLRQTKLTAAQARRLKKLDSLVDGWPTARTPDEQAYEDLMRRVVTYAATREPPK